MEACVGKCPSYCGQLGMASEEWGCGRKHTFPLIEWMKDNEIKIIKGHFKMG